MDNRLVEIESEKWEELKVLYEPETSETILGLSTINNYIRWIKRDASLSHLAFYSLNGDWSDGTFVVVVSIQTNMLRKRKYKMSQYVCLPIGSLPCIL